MQDRDLFKGKREDNDEWTIGILTQDTGGSYFIITQMFDEEVTWCGDCGMPCFEYHKVDPATVGRCAGLTDKNGKLIFEGDVLQFNDMVEVVEEEYEFVEGFDFINTATVCWRKGRFELVDFSNDNSRVLGEMDVVGHDEFIFTFSLSEVVGNIHDKK